MGRKSICKLANKSPKLFELIVRETQIVRTPHRLLAKTGRKGMAFSAEGMINRLIS